MSIGWIIRTIIDRPWLLAIELNRLLLIPVNRSLFFLSGIKWQRGWKVYGAPILQVHRNGSVVIGDRLVLRSDSRSNPLGVDHPVILSARAQKSKIKIGNDFGMTGGSIVTVDSITIGDRVIIGANCLIIDCDFHPLDHELRKKVESIGRSSPVVIGDDVFIGARTIVLKGVSIGARSVVGAGSVVTHSIPSDVLAAGNPAKVIKSLEKKVS